ncbi:MAG TPA: hypothetical protein VGD64_00570 [Acidisarcina sp.]
MNPKLKVVLACSTLMAAVPMASAQAADPTAKPSPYVGVSQPPPDDTIVSSPDLPPPAIAVAPQAPGSPALVRRPANPDAGIVTTPVEPVRNESSAAYGSRDIYHPRNPDAEIVTYVPTRPGELPQGTNINIRLNQQISSSETRAGSLFSGQVAHDVTLSGRVVIPQGSELRGRVESVREGHRFANRATIRLRPDSIILPDGSQYALHAALIGAHGRNTRVDDEGSITPKSHLKKDTVAEGIGAGAGAVTGAAFGGAPGALVGSLVGVGVVTTHLIVQHPQVVDLPSNTTIVFSLTEPLALTPVLE